MNLFLVNFLLWNNPSLDFMLFAQILKNHNPPFLSFNGSNLKVLWRTERVFNTNRRLIIFKCGIAEAWLEKNSSFIVFLFVFVYLYLYLERAWRWQCGALAGKVFLQVAFKLSLTRPAHWSLYPNRGWSRKWSDLGSGGISALARFSFRIWCELDFYKANNISFLWHLMLITRTLAPQTLDDAGEENVWGAGFLFSNFINILTMTSLGSQVISQ